MKHVVCAESDSNRAYTDILMKLPRNFEDFREFSFNEYQQRQKAFSKFDTARTLRAISL